MISARRIALAALSTWRTAKKFADSIIADLLETSKLRAGDRAFALELFYGVLRNLTLLDFWITSLRRSHLDPDFRDVLRLGLYQLFILKTPAHAAVYETVELAPGKQRSLLNGILRAAVRRKEQLQRTARKQPLHVRFSHPRFLLERWRKNFGDLAADLCNWDNQPPPIYVRINQIKTSRSGFLSAHPNVSSLLGYPNFVEVSEFPRGAIERGECYVQDPSTAMACHLLDPKPGEKTLDTCAAPGGKTGYLAEKMENRGTIVACDRDPRRLKLLRENLARLGVAIAQIHQHDWEKSSIPDEIISAAPFDRILIDAPCSNTGVMRRRVDVRWRLRATEFGRMHERQLEIVNAASRLLKLGGALVYSTCSLEPEENDEVAASISRAIPTLIQNQQNQMLPFRDHFDGAFSVRFVRTR